MKLSTFLIYLLLTLPIPFLTQKKVVIHVTPADAIIFDIQPGTKELRQIGVGTATVLIQKNSLVTVVVQKAGFADLKRTYSTITNEKLPKEEFFTMKDRLVKLKVWPADAIIFANGDEMEKTSTNIIVKDGEQMNVEVKKTGFLSAKKTYTNQPDAELPPVNDEIKLKDRIIKIVTFPSDAKILVDNNIIGPGNGDVTVPSDHCVIVKVVKEGYVELEQTYCNREGIADLPIKESFSLQDRLVMVRTTPENATIKINDKYIGKGEYNVKIPKGECVEVTAEKEGSISVRKNYCNQDNAPIIPVVDKIELDTDETFAMSSPSDSVNINNIIEINPNHSEADSWKIMSQIVMNVFDVIEVTDKATGYLRTAWLVKSFPNNTIRTRIIVKVADSSKLKFAVKLCSEASGKRGSSANDDSLYSEWNRVLSPYKDLLSNIQLRLK
jgi:hypothetical protein